MIREEVYNALESERFYQDEMWGALNDPKTASYEPSQFIIDIEMHLNKAKQANYNTDFEEVMNEFRKIGALTVKCGEVHGMKPRHIYELEVPNN